MTLKEIIEKIKEDFITDIIVKYDYRYRECHDLAGNEINKILLSDLESCQQTENELQEEMIKMLISYQTTFDVLQEIFEKNNPVLWGMIVGSFVRTFENKSFIEKYYNKSWEEIIKE